MTNDPLVSVIIPAYNAERFIERTLASVLQQTYRHLEVIVIDDGSGDRTADRVRQIAAEDSRVCLLQQSNAGVAAARNLGIQQSAGVFIAPIDADDIWFPNQIQRQVALMQASPPEVGVVYSWSVDIDEEDGLLGRVHAATINGDVFNTLVCHNFIGNASATLIRRDCLDAIGGYDASLNARQAQGCEDWDLYLRLSERYQFWAVPELLVGYRKVHNAMSCDYTQMARSHSLMLQAVQQRQPQCSTLLFRLSASSFYLYLAQQCSDRGGDRQTLFWLLQAFKAECITPCLRPGTYKLALVSGIRLVVNRGRSPMKSANSPGVKPRLPLMPAPDGPRFFAQHQHLPILRFKLLVGQLLHQGILLIMRLLIASSLNRHRLDSSAVNSTVN
ncbi:MAG: glycosyltransferase family 2 protein [Kaiparowitsia implicata GSE-PSE-MK54-09C]|jgi:glycosyltransferase involved in cell wall biosynthesis|nr:glycosyltransferase family 2 protein [Kaiparowitsia implicata GSE-PSE-MK54-09C]